jgi:DNA-binding response OmpR family regulator
MPDPGVEFMELVMERGTYFLQAQGKRLALTAEELKLFKLMTPLGRKVTLRRRALDRIAEDPSDVESRIILDLFHLPAREWSFRIP